MLGKIFDSFVSAFFGLLLLMFYIIVAVASLPLIAAIASLLMLYAFIGITVYIVSRLCQRLSSIKQV